MSKAQFESTTGTAPACWASALVNGDYSSFDPTDSDGKADLDAIAAKLAIWASEGWSVVDVARDETGEAEESRFTWHYGLHGGTAQGGDVLDYVLLRQKPSEV